MQSTPQTKLSEREIAEAWAKIIMTIPVQPAPPIPEQPAPVIPEQAAPPFRGKF